MSIQSEITRLETAKSAIAAAIAGKGVTVPDGTLLDGMAALIEAIQAGGGGGFQTGIYTPAEDNWQGYVTIDLASHGHRFPDLVVFTRNTKNDSLGSNNIFAGILVNGPIGGFPANYTGYIYGYWNSTTALPAKKSEGLNPTVTDEYEFKLNWVSYTNAYFKSGVNYIWYAVWGE